MPGPRLLAFHVVNRSIDRCMQLIIVFVVGTVFLTFHFTDVATIVLPSVLLRAAIKRYPYTLHPQVGVEFKIMESCEHSEISGKMKSYKYT